MVTIAEATGWLAASTTLPETVPANVVGPRAAQTTITVTFEKIRGIFFSTGMCIRVRYNVLCDLRAGSLQSVGCEVKGLICSPAGVIDLLVIKRNGLGCY